jgi:hypothetical protein
VRRSRGLHEWSTREGDGRGSPQYAASAGALGRAVYEGLFGVLLGADGLRLRVRLGATSGSLRLQEPATGRRIVYEYSYAPDRIRLRWQAAPAPIDLALRLPEGIGPRALRVASLPREVDVERVGDDRYLVVGAVPAQGSLEVALEAHGETPPSAP